MNFSKLESVLKNNHFKEEVETAIPGGPGQELMWHQFCFILLFKPIEGLWQGHTAEKPEVGRNVRIMITV
jgi:hypothetical protein